MHDSPSTKRLIAAVIRDVLATQRYEQFADFRDALRRRLAKLKIAYVEADFDHAITVVASNTELSPLSLPVGRKVTEAPPPPEISAIQAAELLARLGVNVRGGRLQPTRAKSGKPDGVDGFELVEVR
jgi:hypothetical protein